MTDTKPNETSLALLKTLMDSLAHEIVGRSIPMIQRRLTDLNSRSSCYLLTELAAAEMRERDAVIMQRKRSAPMKPSLYDLLSSTSFFE